jgi:transmembrane sensor
MAPESGHAEDELIIRSLQQLASAEEERQLAEWLRASSANQKYYGEVAAIWAATGLAYQEPATAWPDAAIARHRTVVRRISGGSRTASRWRWARLAAAAVLVAGAGLSIESFGTDEETAPLSSFGANEYHTGNDERATVRLADGSVVRLAPASRLRITGNNGAREVTLNGRAFFAVAKDSRFPFIVRTDAGEAHVLGTRFEVGVTNGELRVVVVEGRVEVKAREQTFEVTGGQMALAADGHEPSVVEVDVHSMLDWMGQALVFQDTPLGEAIREIQLLYGAEIHLRDKELANRMITAWFVDQPFQDVMAIVCRLTQVKCAIGPNTAEITTRVDSAATTREVSS